MAIAFDSLSHARHLRERGGPAKHAEIRLSGEGRNAVIDNGV